MKTKTALVTGASSGIGYVFAKQLAKEGYQITAVARNEENLQNLVAELGVGHQYIAADLTNTNQLDNVAAQIKKNQYSLLVNNAGVGIYDRFQDVNTEQYQSIINLNIGTVLILSSAFLKTAKPGDALINVSSLMARLALPGAAVYAASRSFVNSLTEALWFENKKRDVYVMSLQPGLTKTSFHDKASNNENQTLPRMMFSPESVVTAAIKELKKRKNPVVLTSKRQKVLALVAGRILSRKKMINVLGNKVRLLN